jgi:hypothetical protein
MKRCTVDNLKVIAALQEFKKMDPWKGSVGERIDKFRWLHKQMNIITHKEVHLAFFLPASIKDWYNSGGSFYTMENGREYIVLQGRLSVITFLHEWGHALGMEQQEAQEWATMLFQKVWPEKMAKLQQLPDGMLVKRAGEG